MDLSPRSVVVNWSNGSVLKTRMRLTVAISGVPGWTTEHLMWLSLIDGGSVHLGGDVPPRARPIVYPGLVGPTVRILEEAKLLEARLFGDHHRIPGTPLRLNRIDWRAGDGQVTLSLLGQAMADGTIRMFFGRAGSLGADTSWSTPRNRDIGLVTRLDGLARGAGPLVSTYGAFIAGLLPVALPDPPAR